MKGAERRYILMAISTLLLGGCGSGLGGCGESNEQVQMVMPDASTSLGTPVEEEGPQYQAPTIEVLQGKPQKFPTKYPLKKYPNSQVVMALVEPNLRPGLKNVVTLKTPDQKPNVVNFYRNEIAKEGYKPTYDYQNLSFGRSKWIKDGKEIEVRVCPHPSGQRTIQLLEGPYAPIETYGLEDIRKH